MWLSLRFSERHVTALNFILVGAIAYFAARSFNDIVAWRLAGQTIPGGPATQISRVSAAAPVRSQYGIITERDIFNWSRQAAPAPVMVADLRARLLGTSHLTLSKPFAIILDERNLQQSLYRLGDDIPDVGRLIEIEKNRVIIDRAGQRVALEIPPNQLGTALAPEPSAAAEPRPRHAQRITHGPRKRQRQRSAPAGVMEPPAPPPEEGPPPAEDNPQVPDDDVRQTGTNRFQLARGTVDERLQNLGPLLTQMRAIPNLEDGRANGFRLSDIQPGSLFQRIGLRDGDVVTAIAGTDLTDPARAIELLGILRGRDAISVKVLRAGRPLELNYDIR